MYSSMTTHAHCALIRCPFGTSYEYPLWDSMCLSFQTHVGLTGIPPIMGFRLNPFDNSHIVGYCLYRPTHRGLPVLYRFVTGPPIVGLRRSYSPTGVSSCPCLNLTSILIPTIGSYKQILLDLQSSSLPLLQEKPF